MVQLRVTPPSFKNLNMGFNKNVEIKFSADDAFLE